MKQPLILILSTLLLAACGTPGEARQERFTDRLDYGHRSVHYQQDSLMLVDPKGDAYLLRMLDTIPIKVFTHLVNGSLPQAERDKRPADFRIGKTLAFDSRQLLNKCREIMRRNYPDIIPTLGEEHKWSPEAKRYMTYGYWHRLWRRLNGKQQDYPCPLFLRSKLLPASPAAGPPGTASRDRSRRLQNASCAIPTAVSSSTSCSRRVTS